MYPVSQEFIDKIKANERQVFAKLQVDYTSPFLDQSITVAANENANASFPSQTADSVPEPFAKIASLDGSWVLDGTYALAPVTTEEAETKQMGWWGKQLAGTGGAFSTPYPTLTVTFFPRPITKLQAVGDSKREEWPVDFNIKLYDGNNTLLHTETVTGNTQIAWGKTLVEPTTQVEKMTLELTKWSHEGRQAKILEFFTSIQETYEGDNIILVHLLEEREVSQGSLPVGNISANEIDIRLFNLNRKFDAGNKQSSLYQLLKANRRIKAWLGVEVERIINERAIEFAEFNASFPIFHEILKYGSDEPSGYPLFFEIVQDGTAGFEQSLYIHREKDSGNLSESHLINKAVSVDIDVTELSAITLYINRIGTYNMGLRCWLDDTIVLSTTTPGWNQYNIDVSGLSGTKTLKIGVYAWSSPYGGEYLICGIEKHFSEPVIEKETEYVPLGTFWSGDWHVPEDEVYAATTGRDRLELLRKSTYSTSQVQMNKTLYGLAQNILQDAGLTEEECYIDTELQQFPVPYAWFDSQSHREALRKVAEACLGQVYCDRNGIIRIEGSSFLQSQTEPVATITQNDYFRKDNPVKWSEIANYVEVETQPLRPDVSQEIYRSNDPVSITAGQTRTITAYYNHTPCIEAQASLENAVSEVQITKATYYAWGANITVYSANTGTFELVIDAKPLKVLNKERATAQDEESIFDNGMLKYTFPANPLVQTREVAQTIADTLLAYFKNPRRDVEVEWRGNPALLLGDRVAVIDKDETNEYYVTRQELEFDGALQAHMSGRRA